MELPSICNIQSEGGKHVYRLKKALYSLKQSSGAWFERFTKSIKAFGYKQSNLDHTLFVKHNKGMITCLIMYIDDMILIGNDLEERSAL